MGFAAGVIVGAAADHDDDHCYYGYGGWGYHGAALCSDGWDDTRGPFGICRGSAGGPAVLPAL